MEGMDRRQASHRSTWLRDVPATNGSQVRPNAAAHAPGILPSAGFERRDQVLCHCAGFGASTSCLLNSFRTICLLTLFACQLLSGTTPAPSPDPSDHRMRDDAAIETPVSLSVPLRPDELQAAREHRLGRSGIGPDGGQGGIMPVQWEFPGEGANPTGVWLARRPVAERAGGWRTNPQPFADVVTAVQSKTTGQIELVQNGNVILRYNYYPVSPGHRIDLVSEANRIYAKERSNYIHTESSPACTEENLWDDYHSPLTPVLRVLD